MQDREADFEREEEQAKFRTPQEKVRVDPEQPIRPDALPLYQDPFVWKKLGKAKKLEVLELMMLELAKKPSKEAASRLRAIDLMIQHLQKDNFTSGSKRRAGSQPGRFDEELGEFD